MSASWIDYKGKEILFIDYRGLGMEESLETLNRANEMMQERGGKILVLVDTRDTYTSPEFMARLKESGKQLGSVMEKQAVVGITGLKAILLDAYNRFTGASLRPFSTQEEAKEWLVQ
jgi:phenylalanyl-tRNA synthetase beta subunit